MRSKTYLRATAACATILALGACTPATDSPVAAPPPIAVDFDPVDVPTEMRAPASRVWGLSAVAATAELPMVLAGLRAEPGEPPTVGMWSYTGGAPKLTPIDVGLAGAAQSATVASSPDVTALAGHFWKDGTTEAFLMTSADRVTWHQVALPDPGTVRVAQVLVVGPTAYAVGEGTGESLLGYSAAAGEAVGFQLPDLEDGHQRTLVGIAGHGNELVVVAHEGPPDETGVPVVYRSPDVGQTWTGPQAIHPDAPGSASGIVWTGSTYVITGSAEVPGDPTKVRQPAAWSGDGAVWAAETMPSVWPDGEQPTVDAGLSAPASSGADGSAAAAVWREGKTQTSALRRGADGRWALHGESDAETSLAAGGTTVIGEDGLHFVVTESHGAAVLYRVTADAEWINAGRLAPRSDWFSADDLLDTSAGLRVHTSKPYLTVIGRHGWRSGSTGAVFSVRAKRLTPTAWEPTELNGPGSLTVARGADGAEVIMSTDWGVDHETVVVTGAFRAGPDSPWNAVVGFPTEGASGVASVLWTGQDWIATGYVSEGPGAHQPAEPAIWTSPDGISWAPSTEGLDLVDEDSSFTRPCVMPDGTLLVIGQVVVDGEEQAAAWRRDTLWSRVTVPTITDDGSFTGCVTTDDGLIVRRESDGPDALWRTKDGATFERTFAVAPGDTMLEVEAVPGGFAAFGAIDTAEYAGPVLWLSLDGADWHPVPAPVRENTAAALVAANGTDLLVVVSTSSGEQVFTVAGIEQVIADVAAQDG